MLNMDHLNLTKEWEKETRTWVLRDIYATVAYVAVDLWACDDFAPRDLEVVLDQFIDKSLNELVEIIREILFSIREFRQWNTMPSKDFIDLYAFMQNVYCELRKAMIEAWFFEKER